MLRLTQILIPGMVLALTFTASGDDKVIYGTDDRLDVYEISDPDILGLASSVCLLVGKSALVFDDVSGEYVVPSHGVFGSGLCEGEPFIGQPLLGFCSGFLAGPDIVVTAGHCIDSSDLSEVYFVFGYDMLDESTPNLSFLPSQVYTGNKILGHELTSDRDDYSVVRLDRVVTAPGAAPLAYRTSGTIAVGEPVGLIGHPVGLPKKVAFGAQTSVSSTRSAAFFESNVDAYGGNSGSPVFNQLTLEVEGILVRGAGDFVQANGCTMSSMLDNGDAGEASTKVARFKCFIEGDCPPPKGKTPPACGGNATASSSTIKADLLLAIALLSVLLLQGSRSKGVPILQGSAKGRREL